MLNSNRADPGFSLCRLCAHLGSLQAHPECQRCSFQPFCCHSQYVLICHCRSSSLKAWMVFSFMQRKCKFASSELYFHVGLCYFRRPAHQIPTASPLRQLKQGKHIGLVLLKCSLFPLLSLLLPPFFFNLHTIRYATLSPAAASETTVAHREQSSVEIFVRCGFG